MWGPDSGQIMVVYKGHNFDGWYCFVKREEWNCHPVKMFVYCVWLLYFISCAMMAGRQGSEQFGLTLHCTALCDVSMCKNIL